MAIKIDDGTRTTSHSSACLHFPLLPLSRLVIYWSSSLSEKCHRWSCGAFLIFLCSYDRYRPGIRASWKDGASSVYDLGSHLLDQALKLFGRPARITAFIQNIRGVTKPEVDDIVSHIPGHLLLFFIEHIHWNLHSSLSICTITRGLHSLTSSPYSSARTYYQSNLLSYVTQSVAQRACSQNMVSIHKRIS
jgi:hypothetical protein